MKIELTSIPGCMLLSLDRRSDDRGFFLKLFHTGQFEDFGLETTFREFYYSLSRRGVVRGMHLQTPPHQHAKLVHCFQGAIFDVVLDLRVGSPSYGQALSVNLQAEQPRAIYIPPGCAHGFCATSTEAGVFYGVTTVYAPDADKGVQWRSVDVPWPVDATAVVSPRDAAFPDWRDWESPFVWLG